MRYISNAFSLQMLEDNGLNKRLDIRDTDEFHFNKIKNESYSVVGHKDTAEVLGVNFNRESVTLKQGDKLFVAQLVGGRLPEGVKTLPEGFSFKYLVVEVK